MNRIIAFSGTHGTGKTTAALEYAAKIKCDYPRQTIGLVIDVERHCPYPINRKSTERAQQWIFAHQLAAEQAALAKYSLVVSDRTIMDIVAYTLSLGFDSLARRMRAFAEGHMAMYRRIEFRSISQHNFLINDGVRDLDARWRQKTEDILLTLYHQIGVAQAHNFSDKAMAN